MECKPLLSEKKKNGQGLLEFALVLPIILLLVFGIIEFARIFQAWLVISNAARFGVRYAVTGEYDYTNYCDPTLYPNIPADLNGSGKACRDEDGTNWPGNPSPSDAQIRRQRYEEIDEARLRSIHDVVEELLVGIILNPSADIGQPGYYKITVCSSNPNYTYWPWPDDECRPDENPGNPDVAGSNRVSVYVTYQHPLILPILNSILPSVRLQSQRTGILENFRISRVLALPPSINLPTITPQPTATPSSTPTPSATPIPGCSCQVGAPLLIGEGIVEFPVSNQDTVDWALSDLSFNWSYAEELQTILGPADSELYVDDAQWDDRSYFEYSSYDPAIRRISSTDYPDSPTMFNNFVPNLFPSGSTYYMRFDFSNLWESWPTGLNPDDFGLRLTATNGCVCNRDPIERDLPTPAPTPTELVNICDGTTTLGPMLAASDGWFAQDIGTSVTGTTIEREASQIDAAREVYICGSGDDIWGTRDEFRFVTRLDNSGISEFKARLIGFEGPSDFSKAGVMIRSSTSTSAAFSHMLISTNYGARYQYRSFTGSNAQDDAGHVFSWDFRTPVWLRVVKIGRMVTGYISQDGETWMVGDSQILDSLEDDYYLGLAVTSHRDGEFAQAIFDNVSYNTPDQVTCEYQESGFGAVIFETEHFNNAVTITDSDGTFYWTGVTTPTGFSGDGAMLADPPNPANKNFNLTINGPRLDYSINFQTPGRYYIYVRARVDDYHLDGRGNDDSLLVGFDGWLISNTDFGVTNFVDYEWRWQDMYGNRVIAVDISNPGVHTFNIWMRENGLVADRIFIMNADYLGITRPSSIDVSDMWDVINYENPGWVPSCSGYQVPTPTLSPTLTATPICSPGSCTSTPTQRPTGTNTPRPTRTPTLSPTPTSRISNSPTPRPPTATPTQPRLPSRTPTSTQQPTRTSIPSPTPTRTPPFGG